MKLIFVLSVLKLLLIGTFEISAQKFAPPEGKKLLIIGQDLGAIGGFDSPDNDGYTDHFTDIPAGITTYTSLSTLGGLNEPANWGSGNVCAQCILDNTRFNNSTIIIGLYIVNDLDNITSGNLDDKITELGTWIRDAKRPVFLRIGYEFNGSWNNYNPTKYKASFRKICDELKLMGVINFATVWQSEGSGTANALLNWYPGDEYVDWMGYSHFKNSGSGIIELAKLKSKPVMIAEAAPQRNLMTEDGELIWNDWFEPLFTHIANNEVIKALAYINVDWESQSMWTGQGWGDSRIEVNPIITTKWLWEIESGKWLFADSKLFNNLRYFPEHVNFLKPGGNEFIVSGENDQLKIRSFKKTNEQFMVEIFSVTGSKVANINLTSSQDNFLDFSSPPGFYLVKIFRGSVFETHKISRL